MLPSAEPYTPRPGGKTYNYHAGLCPVAEEVLNSAIRMPVSEFFTENDAADMVAAVKKVAAGLRK